MCGTAPHVHWPLMTCLVGWNGSSAPYPDSCPPSPPPPGRRPAFCINSVTVLGRQSIAELAAEAAELAAAAAAAGAPPVAHTNSPPSAATISKSLLAMTVLALGVPIIPQARLAGRTLLQGWMAEHMRRPAASRHPSPMGNSCTMLTR